MSKFPLQPRPRRDVRPLDPDAGSVVVPPPEGSGFFSFRYSYTELSSSAGRTRVKSTQTRLEGGKLSTETFEGELEAGAYDHTVRQVQQQLLDQMAQMLRPLSWWWPALRGPRGPRGDRE